jgi:hypothetical protein
MRVLRAIGQVFVILGAALLAFGAWLWFAGNDMTQAAGQLWFALDKESLNTAQVVVQRYIYADLWDSFAVPLLQRRAWLAVAILVVFFVVIGGLIMLAARPRRPRRFRP